MSDESLSEENRLKLEFSEARSKSFFVDFWDFFCDFGFSFLFSLTSVSSSETYSAAVKI